MKVNQSAAALQLIAQGWTVVESDGAQITIQAPEGWDGAETEKVVKTDDRLSIDAGYALGEEAFRAGFKAGYAYGDRVENLEPQEVEEQAWTDYEPSEDVKALIDGTPE